MAQKTFTRVWAKDAPYNGPITLDKELGAGGEGSVFDIRNKPDIVAKIYHLERRTSNVFKKLELMIQYPPRTEDEHNGHLYVAWPKHLVYDSADNTIGFVMPKVNKKTACSTTIFPHAERRARSTSTMRAFARSPRAWQSHWTNCTGGGMWWAT